MSESRLCLLREIREEEFKALPNGVLAGDYANAKPSRFAISKTELENWNPLTTLMTKQRGPCCAPEPVRA